ncbi:MAG: ABC transporter permease [Acidobacteriota bacterium]
MSNLVRDFRYALRLLTQQPTFTLVIVITLALGIGANTAIFTVVSAALIRSLPYRDAQTLVHLSESKARDDSAMREASYPDFLDWRQNESFAGMAAYSGGGSATITESGATERIAIGSVTGNFFDVLGVDALLGRTFRPDEDQPQTARVAVLSHALWQRMFAGNQTVIGRSVRLNEAGFTIVGVLPPSFHFAPRGAAQLWVAWRPSEGQLSRRYMHWVNVIARLKPGVTTDEADRSMQLTAARIARDYPESHTDRTIRIQSLQERFVGPIKPILLSLSIAVALVLLIACANIANLLLARATVRRREIAIRSSLGATRWDLMRQMLVESVLLAMIGGAIGFILAQFGVDALIAAIPEGRLATMPYLRGLKLDAGLLGFTAVLSLLVGMVFGLAPALQLTRQSLQEALKEGSRTLGSHHQRLRSSLIVGEIALCFVLLIAGGLMVKSLLRLLAVDPGFRTANLLALTVSLPAGRYSDEPRVLAFYEQLIASIKAVPGVADAATVDVLPTIGGNTTKLNVEGRQPPPPGEEVEMNFRSVSANYFSTVGVALDHGRRFDERDNQQGAMVVMINRTLADRLFRNEDPVGRRVTFVGDDPTPYQVIGVVADEKVNSIDSKVTPVVYVHSLQDVSPTASLIVRTSADPQSVAATIRREAKAIEPDLSVYGVTTMDELIAGSPATFARRYPALLIGLFAVLALILSATGLYGLISYSVSQRTRELGIRVALGAGRRDILKLVMRRGVILAVSGLGLGLVLALTTTRLLTSMLYGVSPTDPSMFAGLAGLLGGVALLSCYLPARRATAVDPLIALRDE